MKNSLEGSAAELTCQEKESVNLGKKKRSIKKKDKNKEFFLIQIQDL